jgi:chromate transporter
MSAWAWGGAAALTLALAWAPQLWNPTLGQLNVALMKLGALAFGGGFTMIPLIQHEVVERAGWLTTREFIDGIALGQVTPGPIVITATFVGYRVGGVLGAATSTAAVLLPSFLILMAALPRYDQIKASRLVRWMTHGVLAAFIALLAAVLVQFGQAALVGWKSWALGLGAAAALWWEIDLLAIVGATAILSILLF